jgi:hypothetical protein
MPYLRMEPFPGAAQERTFHVLIKADISCATHSRFGVALTENSVKRTFQGGRQFTQASPSRKGS